MTYIALLIREARTESEVLVPSPPPPSAHRNFNPTQPHDDPIHVSHICFAFQSQALTGPVKLLFPRPGAIPGDFPWQILGLGDVAIPGLLACLALVRRGWDDNGGCALMLVRGVGWRWWVFAGMCR